MLEQYGGFVLMCFIVFLRQSVVSESHFTNEWVAEISGGLGQAHAIAKRYGFEDVRSMPHFEDHYILSHRHVPHRSKRSAGHFTDRLTGETQVQWATQQISRQRVKRSVHHETRRDGHYITFNDPALRDQWYFADKHANSRDVRGSVVHTSMGVEGAWRKGYTGRGVVVTICDDGVEHSNPDLQANYDPSASTDLNDNDPDPFPRYDPTNENKHGTRCAGVVAMTANNSVCGVGIAYNSKIGGVRMLDGRVTDRVEAQSLSFNHTYIDIFSASWGPTDDGTVVEGPDKLSLKAMETGIQKGRGGKGVIYVWASGNGGRKGDSCSCDGYSSSIYTLSVSSATEHGMLPWYGERCASTLATTFSSGTQLEHQVVSTDLHHKCTTHHTGTSASAPMAAGIIALVLEANPSLTWRAVQHLVVATSKPQSLASVDGWYKNGAGFCVNLAFGFGLLDAEALVTLAQPGTWDLVPPKAICVVKASEVSHFPQQLSSGHMLEVLIETDGCANTEDEVNYLEHVQFVVTMTYSRRGDLTVTAISPSGTETVLLPARRQDKSSAGFKRWPFTSVHNWGERSDGLWRFRVYDESTGKSNTGQLEDVELVLYGTKTPPAYLNATPRHCHLQAGSNEAENSPARSAHGLDDSKVHQVLEDLSMGDHGTLWARRRRA